MIDAIIGVWTQLVWLKCMHSEGPIVLTQIPELAHGLLPYVMSAI